MFKFLKPHITQVVASDKKAVECYCSAKHCSVVSVIVNINEHFTNTNIGEFCAYDPAGS
jgi:hypothetical protein